MQGYNDTVDGMNLYNKNVKPNSLSVGKEWNNSGEGFVQEPFIPTPLSPNIHVNGIPNYTVTTSIPTGFITSTATLMTTGGLYATSVFPSVAIAPANWGGTVTIYPPPLTVYNGKLSFEVKDTASAASRKAIREYNIEQHERAKSHIKHQELSGFGEEREI